MKQLLLLMVWPFSVFSQEVKMKLSETKQATAFIHSLSMTQQKIAVFPFDEMNRFYWNFLPASMVERTGIAMNDLNDKQKKNLDNLLQAYLSKEGYKRVNDIMSFEYILKELEPNNANRIPGNYKVALYGKPEKDSVWGWKFSGHHIALNFTVVDGKLAFSPFFFGANPGIVKSGPQKGTQLLRAEEELGFQLLNGMSPEQQGKAIFQQKAFDEIVTDSAKHVKPLEPVGIAESELSADQKTILHQLILAYLYSMPPYISKARMNRINTEDLNSIRFGWAGEKEMGKPHYYRIQGKTFLIELDNTQNNANHVHTVWRDFNGDFGEDLLREHYHSEPHH